MLLNRKFVKANIKEIESNLQDYMVLRNPYSFDRDVELLGYGFNIANLCNTLRLYNEFCEDIGTNQKLDFSVLSKVLLAIYQNKPFTLDELKEYYTFSITLERLGKAMSNFSTGLSEHVYTDTDTDTMLLGFGWEKQARLKDLNSRLWGELNEEVFNIKWEVIEGKRTVESLQKDVLNLLEKALKEEEDKARGESKAA
jgi:hypothetical protein